MGEKEQGLATAREPHTGRASGRMSAEAEHDPGGGGIAIGEEGVQVSEPGQGGAPSALATNLNSSKSNVYRSGGGEPPGGGALETSNLNLSKSNINRTAAGDPDFNLAAQKKMPDRDRGESR